MNIPHKAHVVIANGEKFLLMRNSGPSQEPKLEKVDNLDLLLTNFSAGIRHHDAGSQPNQSTNIDELAHGAAIAEWLNDKVLKNEMGKIVVAADPRTLGQIRQHYHKETQALVAGEVDKDLTNLSIPDIEKTLAAA